MEYTSRTVRSRPGLTQEEALASLQSHPLFKPGTKIAGIRRRGDRWVADLLEPKTADFPPSDDGGEDAGPPKPPVGDGDGDADDAGPPSDDGGDDGSDSPDGPPSDDEGGDKKKHGEKAEIGQLLQLVQSIADALGVSVGPDPAMGGPDALGPGPAGGPDGPPPPPAGGPDAGGPPAQEINHRTKMSPGDVPPGGTPVGAPAFSSVQSNSVSVPVPGAAAASPMGGPADTGSHCPHGMDPATCPECNSPGYAGGAVTARKRVASFVASQPDPQRRVTIKQAKASLDAEFGPQGYTVKQIKRDGNTIRALLSARK